jgi:hypothetical protein
VASRPVSKDGFYLAQPPLYDEGNTLPTTLDLPQEFWPHWDLAGIADLRVDFGLQELHVAIPRDCRVLKPNGRFGSNIDKIYRNKRYFLSSMCTQKSKRKHGHLEPAAQLRLLKPAAFPLPRILLEPAVLLVTASPSVTPSQLSREVSKTFMQIVVS